MARRGFTWLFNKPVIYHGVFGHGLFQSIYPPPQSAHRGLSRARSNGWRSRRSSAVLCVPFEQLRIVPYLMLLGTVMVALSYMANARIEPKFDTIPARLLVGFLAFMQPLGRGWARYFTWLQIQAHSARRSSRPTRRNCRRSASRQHLPLELLE